MYVPTKHGREHEPCYGVACSTSGFERGVPYVVDEKCQLNLDFPNSEVAEHHKRLASRLVAEALQQHSCRTQAW